MSPSNINSFVGDLVQMAQAMEQLPKVQEDLDRANDQIETYARQVQDREIAIIAYKQEIDYLHAKVRSLEVERDDASFRVLESEDLAHKALSFAKQAETAAAAVMSLLDPPKPEPVKEPEPQDQSAMDPTTVAAVPVTESGSVSGTAIQSESASTSTTIPDTVHSISELSGQSESSPTVEAGQVETVAPWTPATNTDVGSTITETSSVNSSLPYFGKRYYDLPTWVPLNEWTAGGGLEADYYWRPSHRTGSDF